MAEGYTWGNVEQFAAQGWAHRSNLDMRYWSASWSSFWNTLERDGKQTFREYGSMQSENGKIVSFGDAVTDDFGDLRSVNIRVSRFRNPDDRQVV